MVKKNVQLFGALVGCAVMVVVAGCGRQSRSPLLPRVDVSKVLGGPQSDAVPMDDASAEQYVNNQIDTQRKKVTEGAETILASAEQGSSKWKDRLLPGRKKEAVPTAEDFGADPFLDGLDEMIADAAPSELRTQPPREIASAPSEADNSLFDVATTAAKRELQLPVAKAKELAQQDPGGIFDDVSDQVKNTVAAPVDIFSDEAHAVRKTADTIRDQVNDFESLFSEENATQRGGPGTPAPQHPLEMASSNGGRARELATPPQILREPQQRVDTEPSFPGGALGVDPADFEPVSEFVEPAQLENVETALPSLPTTALMGTEAPLDLAIPGEVTSPQEDASVSANRPAVLPAAEPLATEKSLGLPPADVSSDRVNVDVFNEPAFQEPLQLTSPNVDQSDALGTLDAMDPFATPLPLPAEPAPAFTSIEPAANTMPVSNQDVGQTLTPVNWETSSSVEPQREKNFTAPREWTAWFLLGGAVMIVLLLFAPGRGRDA